MAKRDEIARKLSMMGPAGAIGAGSTSSSNLPSPGLVNPYPTQPAGQTPFSVTDQPPPQPTSSAMAKPLVTQNQGGHSDIHREGLERHTSASGYNVDEYAQGNHGASSRVLYNASNRSPPVAGGSSSAWGQTNQKSSRSRSPQARYGDRREGGRPGGGRAPLPGAGDPGKDEFGRDRVTRRSVSPSDQGDSGRAFKRIRTEETSQQKGADGVSSSIKAVRHRVDFLAQPESLIPQTSRV
jgi:hypothetical protein